MTRELLKGLVVVVAAACVLVPSTAGAFTLDDIQVWGGSGSNRAGLVVRWDNGGSPVALAWGYRWDGPATLEDMVLALAGDGGVHDATGAQGNDGPIIRTMNGADPRLHAQLSEWNFGGVLLRTIYGVGYDADGDGFTYVDGPGETGYAADPDDLYYEGWQSGFYWAVATGDGTAWTPSLIGLGEALSDGAWGGMVMLDASNWDPAPGDFPSYDSIRAAGGTDNGGDGAVPEPATLLLVGLGAAAAGLATRRRRRLG